MARALNEVKGRERTALGKEDEIISPDKQDLVRYCKKCRRGSLM